MINRLILTAIYIGTIVLANILTNQFGMVPAGFGLLTIAGTYSAGIALSVRDALHEVSGVRWVLFAIGAGAAVSALVSPELAMASGAAFLVAELLDLAVYTPLRKRGFTVAVIASNVVGAVVDTLLFLKLAGFPLTVGTVGGQILAKAVWVTAVFLLLAKIVKRNRTTTPVAAVEQENAA